MNIGEKVNISTDGKEISTITGYKFLRALITNDGYTKDEIKKRISLLYGSKCWMLRKADKRKLWMWIRVLRIPQTVIRTNASLTNQIKPKNSLKTLATICKPKYFRHLIRMLDFLEKDLVLGLTDGSSRGIQGTRWSEEIQGILKMNWHDILAATQNRAQCKHLIYKVMENRKHQQE
jgi:hypothetical protein